VIFRGADGSEIAVPWKPLVKNASFAGACGIGEAGLDLAEVGSEAQIGSIAADGTADLEAVKVEPPAWSMANPTDGSMSSGAPVQCEYSGTKAQRWEIRITDDMSFTPSRCNCPGRRPPVPVPPEGVVTESEQEGGTVFGGAPLESEPRLSLRSIQRNADSVTDRLNRAQKDALAERLERVYGGGH